MDWLSVYHNTAFLNQPYSPSLLGKYWCQVINTTGDPDQPLMRSNVFTLLAPGDYSGAPCSPLQTVDNTTCADLDAPMPVQTAVAAQQTSTQSVKLIIFSTELQTLVSTAASTIITTYHSTQLVISTELSATSTAITLALPFTTTITTALPTPDDSTTITPALSTAADDSPTITTALPTPDDSPTITPALPSVIVYVVSGVSGPEVCYWSLY